MPHSRSAAASPVFVDRSGRRRRLMKLLGMCFGLALISTLALLMLAMSGASPITIPGFPAAVGDGAVATTPPAGPAPTTSAGPLSSISDSFPAGVSPSPSDTTRRHVPTQTPSHARPSKTK
jgi:hypothetical protein